MSGFPTTNQGQVNYAIDNTLASHIPTFQRVSQANVPNTNDYKIPKKNVLHIRTNNIAAMPELKNNTITVKQIDDSIQEEIDNWNDRKNASTDPVFRALPDISANSLSLIAPPGRDNQLSNLRVIPWDIYTFWYHSNRSDIPMISPVFSSASQFNFNLMTYKDSHSEFCRINLFALFIDLYCRNNNVNENTLDFPFKIDLRQKLAPFTNAFNYNGEYKATSLQELYMSFAESGLLLWNENHLNRFDGRSNIHSGSIVCIEHQYILIHKVAGDEALKIVFTVPHYVYMPNWVSQTHISYTKTSHTLNKCPLVNGHVSDKAFDEANDQAAVANTQVPEDSDLEQVDVTP